MRKNGVKNVYKIEGDAVYLYITNKNFVNKEIKFNLEHLHEVEKYKWNVDKLGYCKTSSKVDDRIIYLHRLITNCPEGLVVDHINHNPSDNTDANLRVCTYEENMKNVKLRSDNKSGYRGVSYHKSVGKWRCEPRINGKKMWFGAFDTPEEAYQKRLEVEKEYFGEYRFKENEVASIGVETTSGKNENITNINININFNFNNVKSRGVDINEAV